MKEYDKIEEYLPEMKRLRIEYGKYLIKNDIKRTNEELLFDYFRLVVSSYQWDEQNRQYMFVKPDFVNMKSGKERDFYFDLEHILAIQLRQQQMNDRIDGFSDDVRREINHIPDVDNCKVEHTKSWIYKYFPLSEKIGIRSEEEKNVIRFGLNVKPKVGLFKSLDDICIKRNAFYYKIVECDEYNHRKDPVIVYATKDSYDGMVKDLAELALKYRRKDEYKMLGYNDLGNGLFYAPEVKECQVMELMCRLLTKQEAEVYKNPCEDVFVQDDREFELARSIKKQLDAPVKAFLFSKLSHYRYDNSLSSAQFQAYTMMVNMYCLIKEKERSCLNVRNMER